MMSDYDAIVVGSGLGGLSAAAALSKSGKKVLVLEQHNVPGGYATSFTRGAFEFDASLHELSGVGVGPARGPVWHLLDEYGVAEKVEFVPIDDFYRCMYPDLDITIPLGRENVENLLCSEFPSEKTNIKKFIDTLFSFAMEAMQISFSGMNGTEIDINKLPVFLKYINASVADVLHADITDPKLRMLLAQLCNYLGQTPSKSAFFPYAMGVSAYINFGPVHIKGKSQALSQAFVDTLEENGSDVWLNNGAAKIMTANGKITGVVTEDGTQIDCPYVVCNANPFTTCLQLIGKEHIPDWYLQRLSAWTPGIGTFNVFLGLDRPYEYFGITSHETFMGTEYFDWDKQDQQALTGESFDSPGLAVTAYNVADESFSPRGTTALVLTYGGYGDPWKKLSPEQYIETKQRMADKAIERAQMVAPGIRDHIEVMDIATPLTNIRYSGNPGGSFAGFRESRQANAIGNIPARGPLEGLYFSNAWVNMGGGYFPSIMGGKITSGSVLEDMNQAENRQTLSQLKQVVEQQTCMKKQTKPVDSFLAENLTSGFHTAKIPLKVDKIADETPSTRTLRLVPVQGGLPYFRPGQYINIFVEINGVFTSRPYAISSAPGQPWYEITVRRKVDGFVSPYLLDRVKPGDLLSSSIPNGFFHQNPLVDDSDLVFLAGGSGVTPFISMIRHAAKNKSNQNIHLLYGSRSISDIIFNQEIAQLADAHDNIRADMIISEPEENFEGHQGFLDAAMISSLIGAPQGKTFFISGPRKMHELCMNALAELGVPKRKIRVEICGPPEDVTMEPGWPDINPNSEVKVLEVRSGKTFFSKPGEPLMVGLERAGIVIPTICRSGECTACRTRLVSGRVFVPAHVEIRQSDKKANYIHACMSYPLEDIRIRL